MVSFDPEGHPQQFGLTPQEESLAMVGLERLLNFNSRIPEIKTIDTKDPRAAAFVALWHEKVRLADSASYNKAGGTGGESWIDNHHAGTVREALAKGVEASVGFAAYYSNPRIKERYSWERLEPIAQAADAQLAPLTYGKFRRLRALTWLRISDAVFGSSGR